jgi:hypothetical protein
LNDWLNLPPENLDDLADHWEVVPEPSTFGPPAWRSRAACLDKWDDMLEVETARPICEACPVRAQCLAFALDCEPDDTVIFAGTTFADRLLICPVCQRSKQPDELGCSPAHTLLRIARLLQIEAEGDPDVRVTMRAQPTCRTFQHCPIPRGGDHASGKAYRNGCRCEASRKARRAQAARLEGVENPRGSYRRQAG